jgi:hypothetical protein
MPISELERRIIARCEQSWFLQGVLPTPEQLRTEFNLSGKKLQELLESEVVAANFKERGIPTIQGRSLTPDQLLAINTILNFSDTRSEKKKLADMGISAATWNGWRQGAAFKEYMLTRTETILGDSIADVNMAVVDRARNGDLGAIKLVYEMTGRYRGNETNLDPKVLLNKILEIISIHVQDPVALAAISREFAKLAGVATDDTVNTEPPVAGVIVRSEIEGKF